MPIGSLDTDALNGLLAAREERASIGISFVIILLGFMIVVAAFEDFARGYEDESKEEWVLYYVSFLSMIVFGGLGLIKFRFSKMLSSESLYKDGICSMVGAILSASLFCNTVIFLASDGGAWWLDPTVALLCGLGSLAYGLHGIYIAYVIEGLPIFSRKWWKLKRSPSSPTNATTDIENGGRGPAGAGSPTTPNSMGSAGPILMQDHHGSTLSSPYGQDVTNDIVVKRPITTTSPTTTTTTTTSSNMNTTTTQPVLESDLLEPATTTTTTTTSVPPMNAFTPEKAEVSKVPSRSSEDGDDYNAVAPNNNSKDDDSVTEIELT